ncbi:MAG: hypothetical protein B0D91_14750 [Oceanospirillales bacterium LUC14_002_19_P2]|nr:MAG: hypothetical protein B0D91_14750 [Oceanospirillales bacterium LUC14_002_19_P2]
MANVIRIKRSQITGTPASLEEGELAYSEVSGHLFIGASNDTILIIGGVTDHNKLAGIETNANHYSLPTATTTDLGGIKIGSGLNIDGDGVVSLSSGSSITSGEVDTRISNAINNLIAGTPAALDTLNELATALQDNDSELAALTTGLDNRLNKNLNLSDLTDINAARTSLNLGTLALQNHNAATISGGGISNVSLTNCDMDGGSF